MQMRQPSRAKVNLYTCANRMGIAVESVGVGRRVPALDLFELHVSKNFFFLCYQYTSHSQPRVF